MWWQNKIVKYCAFCGKPLVWLMFIVFFTYTFIFKNIIEEEPSFYKCFCDNMAGHIQMIVNLGIVFFVTIDYTNAKTIISRWVIYVMLFAVILVILLNGQLSLLGESNSENYIDFIKSPCLSYILFGLFLLSVYSIKLATSDISLLHTEEPEINQEL